MIIDRRTFIFLASSTDLFLMHSSFLRHGGMMLTKETSALSLQENNARSAAKQSARTIVLIK